MKMGNFNFKLMSFFMQRAKSPAMIDHLLNECGIQPGQTILDYACGPGIFSIPASKIIGPEGHLYAADMEPLARYYIEKNAKQERLSNISVQITNGKLDIPDDTVDTILLFDVVHNLKNADEVFQELHRVLKNGGTLAVEVDHISSAEALQIVQKTGLFQFLRETSIQDKRPNHLILLEKGLS